MSLRGVAALAFYLLGRDVVGCAHDLGELGEGEPAGAFLAGEAEVDELDGVIRADHDVLRLEVAVDDAVMVDVVEGLQDFAGDVHGALGRELGFLGENIAEQAAVDPLHDHVDLAGLVVRRSGLMTFITPGWSSFWPISASRLKRSKKSGSASISG